MENFFFTGVWDEEKGERKMQRRIKIWRRRLHSGGII